MSRRLTVGLGAVLAVLGLIALVEPELTTALPITDTFVSLLGVVLLLGGLRELRRRQTTELSFAETGDPETSLELPTPGDSFDRRLSDITLIGGDRLERERLRKLIGEAALTALVRRRGYTRAEAVRLLEDGDWTDDPFAAAFLARRRPDVPVFELVRERLSGESTFRSRAARAVRAVDRLLEGDDD